MTPESLKKRTLPVMAGMVERRITDILVLLEQIIYLANPQTSEAQDIIGDICNFEFVVQRAYDRVKSTLNELQG